MRIAIDIDSTLHHYWDVLTRVARSLYGVELAYERQTHWQINELTAEQLRDCILETHSDREILAARPYPGAAEVIGDWHSRGYQICIASHRREATRRATGTWLERNNFPYDELHLTADKISHCLDLGIDLIVDDSPPILLEARRHGLATATIIHPWNRTLVERDGVIGAHTWAELEVLLEPLVGGSG